MSVPSWRGRDPRRDCESEGCEGEETCIHCDAEMIDLPADDGGPGVDRARRKREELKAATKEKP